MLYGWLIGAEAVNWTGGTPVPLRGSVDFQNGCVMVAPMITITIKGLSKETHRELKKRAALHGRSLNTEAIAVLESSVRSTPVAAETNAVIQQARAFRNALKFRVTAAEVKRFKEAGRA